MVLESEFFETDTILLEQSMTLTPQVEEQSMTLTPQVIETQEQSPHETYVETGVEYRIKFLEGTTPKWVLERGDQDKLEATGNYETGTKWVFSGTQGSYKLKSSSKHMYMYAGELRGSDRSDEKDPESRYKFSFTKRGTDGFRITSTYLEDKDEIKRYIEWDGHEFQDAEWQDSTKFYLQLVTPRPPVIPVCGEGYKYCESLDKCILKEEECPDDCEDGFVWCPQQQRCISKDDICDYDDLSTLNHGEWTHDEFRDGFHWFVALYSGKSLKSKSQSPGTYEHYMTGKAPNVTDYRGLEYNKDSVNSYSEAYERVEDPDDSFKWLLSGKTYLATTVLPICGDGYKWCDWKNKCIPIDEGCCTEGWKWCSILYKCIPDDTECKIPIFTEPGDAEEPYQLSEWINQGVREDGYYHFTNNIKWGYYNIDTMPSKQEFIDDLKSKIPVMLDDVFEVQKSTAVIDLKIFPKEGDTTGRRYVMGGDITVSTEDKTKPTPIDGSGSSKLSLIRILIAIGFSYSGYQIFLS